MKIVSGSEYFLPEKGYYNCYYPNKKTCKKLDGNEEVVEVSRYQIKGMLADYTAFYFKEDEDKRVYFTKSENVET